MNKCLPRKASVTVGEQLSIYDIAWTLDTNSVEYNQYSLCVEANVNIII